MATKDQIDRNRKLKKVVQWELEENMKRWERVHIADIALEDASEGRDERLQSNYYVKDKIRTLVYHSPHHDTMRKCKPNLNVMTIVSNIYRKEYGVR